MKERKKSLRASDNDEKRTTESRIKCKIVGVMTTRAVTYKA